MAELLKPRIAGIIKDLSNGLYEREETVAVALLAVLSGQSAFLYGPPGTAKSLIARRISQAFKDAKHFEYLMQRFSTPEEVFGPVSIHELKNDKYVRKTEGYLPCADIAFLDEIWKSSPAILNTLLTIINERVFRNGAVESKVPLKALIAASNETPPANQGLEALYDRFVVRLIVSPMEDRKNFERLLQDVPIQSVALLPKDLSFSHEQWSEHLEDIPLVTIPAEVLEVIHAIKCQLYCFNIANPDKTVYVSDRRWQKISLLLKAAAYFCDRDQVLVVDLLLLRHCLWTQESNREPIAALVRSCIRQFGHPDRHDLEKWEITYKELENQINDTFFYTDDVFATESVGGVDCILFTVKLKKNQYGGEVTLKYYAPISNRNSTVQFQPFRENGSVDGILKCSFIDNVLVVQIDSSAQSYGIDYGHKSGKFADYGKLILKPLIKKGTTKDVPSLVKETYVKAAGGFGKEIKRLITSAEGYLGQQQRQNDTPFVQSKERRIISLAMQSYIDELKNHQLNAEHLCEKVNTHANTK